MEFNITVINKKEIKQYLSLNACFADNATVLAEMCAAYFDHPEWLDDETYPIWEWAIESFEE